MEKVTLKITPAQDRPGYYVVAVLGDGFIHSNGKACSAKIRGDDPVFDDDLFTIGGSNFTHVAGSEFSLSLVVHHSQLDEDWGEDEIYAQVWVEGRGTFRTNTVKAHF
jgi:hypothetical protein